MQKYLVTKTEYYYDGHGEAGEGMTKKFISESPIFDIIPNGSEFFGSYCDIEDLTAKNLIEYKIDKDTYMEMDGYIEDSTDASLYAQDGYHTTSTTYTFEKVEDNAVVTLLNIIEAYEAI